MSYSPNHRTFPCPYEMVLSSVFGSSFLIPFLSYARIQPSVLTYRNSCTANEGEHSVHEKQPTRFAKKKEGRFYFLSKPEAAWV